MRNTFFLIWEKGTSTGGKEREWKRKREIGRRDSDVDEEGEREAEGGGREGGKDLGS